MGLKMATRQANSHLRSNGGGALQWPLIGPEAGSEEKMAAYGHKAGTEPGKAPTKIAAQGRSTPTCSHYGDKVENWPVDGSKAGSEEKLAAG